MSADSIAVRVALWRALHVQLDPAPHVFEDEIGAKLAAPDEGWQHRPDMHPQGTARFRASIVARARLVEDLVADALGRGVGQYVVLGAGLDTFAQRRPELGSRMRVFEIDRQGPQDWKRRRLTELGFGVPKWLRFVPVDFEAGVSWRERLIAEGFDTTKPAIVSSLGVSVYLTKEANLDTLRQVASFAAGSTFVMSFLVPIELAAQADRPALEQSANGAKANGTPFISFFEPEDMLKLASDAGFKTVEHVSSSDLAHRYFADRADGLRPPSAEEILLAKT